jgi:hypothetical protein
VNGRGPECEGGDVVGVTDVVAEAAATVAVAAAVSTWPLGSNVEDTTLAVFTIVPAVVVTRTTMCNISETWLARVPTCHTTVVGLVPSVATCPVDPWAETKERPLGRGSVTKTPSDVPGPSFLTVMVYVTSESTDGEWLLTVLARAMTA